MNRSDDFLAGGPSGTPNPHWQRAFEEAAESPPPRVWDAVERQLDLDDEDGIIPLWQHRQGQQSMLFGRWVAGIAASLLLLLGGWWVWHREGAAHTGMQVATATKASQTMPQPSAGTSALGTLPAEKEAGNELIESEKGPGALALAPTRAARPAPVEPQPRQREGVAAAQPTYTLQVSARSDEAVAAAAEARPTLTYTANVPVAAAPRIDVPSQPDTKQPLSGEVVRARLSMSVTITETAPPKLAPFRSDSERAVVAALLTETPPMEQPLAPQPTQNKLILTQEATKPLAVTPDAALAEVVVVPALAGKQASRRTVWVSAGTSAMSVNPMMAARASAVPSLAFVNNTYLNAQSVAGYVPNLEAERAVAVAFQAGVGIPLGEHWAIETGVGYLSSTGGVASPNRLPVASGTAKTPTAGQTFYTDAIASRLAQPTQNQSGAPVGVTSDFTGRFAGNVAQYDITTSQAVSNAYQFVQVPAQVSYEFRPRRKFGLAFLTGIVSNWFVKNTVAESVTVNPSDGLYRPVTMAGTAGVRLRYRPSRQWSASLAGTFQQSLQSITQNDVNFQALPQQVGLSFSVDKHF
jgi:hypothetical protein